MAKLVTLNKKRDFDNARYNGVRFFCKLFFISKVKRYSKEDEKIISSDGPRFGFIISKKISKLAVERNKIRRRLKEVVRKNIDCFDIDHDYVVVVKRAIIDIEFTEIEKQIERAVKFFNKEKKLDDCQDKNRN